MATNVSSNESLRSTLSDIQRHYFSTRRQINPTSILYQTIQRAVKEKLVTNAVIEAQPQHLLATFDLTQADLTPAGLKRLQLLTELKGDK